MPPIAVSRSSAIAGSRRGNRSTSNAPRNTYRTADGRWLAVSASATSIAERVIRLVGRPDLADEAWFSSAIGRADHSIEIDDAVASWIGARTADDVTAAFEAAEAAIAPIYDAADLLADPHVVATEMITTVDDPDLGPIRMPNVLFRMSETPGSIRSTGPSTIGSHTDEVLTAAGIEAARVAALRDRGVVR